MSTEPLHIIKACQLLANSEAAAVAEAVEKSRYCELLSDVKEERDQLRAQLATAEVERDALAKKLSDQSMSVIMDVDEFDLMAKRCEAAEARCKELQKDGERLDRLSYWHTTYHSAARNFSVLHFEYPFSVSLRSAIDATANKEG